MTKEVRKWLQKLADLNGQSQIKQDVDNRNRKHDSKSNEDAIFEIADVADENGTAIFDLADYLASLEARVAALEGGDK